jgi:hypothetical protein
MMIEQTREKERRLSAAFQSNTIDLCYEITFGPYSSKVTRIASQRRLHMCMPRKVMGFLALSRLKARSRPTEPH